MKLITRIFDLQKVAAILIMMAQVLFFNIFFENLNAVERSKDVTMQTSL